MSVTTASSVTQLGLHIAEAVTEVKTVIFLKKISQSVLSSIPRVIQLKWLDHGYSNMVILSW